MRLVRSDLVPVLTIFAGGTAGILASGLALASRSHDVHEPPVRLIEEMAPLAEPDVPLVSMSARYTVPPQILNIEEVRRAMFAAFPKSVRNGEVGGTTTVYFFIDERGDVLETRIDRGSGYRVVDDAALKVADVFSFSPALNGDRPVPVWFSHALTFDLR